MKINIDELLANMPKDEDELKTVQEKYRKILTDNREKEKQRKARTHRLCEHGAILEACFPETIQMDSAQFSAFMQELAAGRCPCKGAFRGNLGASPTRITTKCALIHTLVYRPTYVVRPAGQHCGLRRDGASPIPQE